MSLDHLDPRIADLASRPKDERIAYILADKYVPYGLAEEIIDKAYWILRQERTQRPKCLLLFADSGCGKSMILDEINRRHGGSQNPREVPVVSIKLSGSSDVRMLFIRILRELDVPFSSGDRKDALYDQAIQALRAYGTKVIIIDELHNLLLAKRLVNESMVVIRDLANTPLSLICAGTRAARSCVNADEQLKHRFRCHQLKRWGATKDAREFFATLESRLPLLEPSNLSSAAVATFLINKTQGHVETMVTVIRESGKTALLNNKEAITPEIIEEVVARVMAEKYEAIQ
ncbi:TniB family NTP-binding protein [uncultured Xanthomonas sp.]|uniref:TniB family NTP-binding protein n=1 Tax=uncultured Xanthomonas sp. TaxID=152831 RepID=UPI0025F97707|nr:TniB family NTP-binding protein [uncultured Xanthomonas sp.]